MLLNPPLIPKTRCHIRLFHSASLFLRRHHWKPLYRCYWSKPLRCRWLACGRTKYIGARHIFRYIRRYWNIGNIYRPKALATLNLRDRWVKNSPLCIMGSELLFEAPSVIHLQLFWGTLLMSFNCNEIRQWVPWPVCTTPGKNFLYTMQNKSNKFNINATYKKFLCTNNMTCEKRVQYIFLHSITVIYV